MTYRLIRRKLPIIILSLIAMEHSYAAGSFSNLPLNLQQGKIQSKSGGGKQVKPNVMFLVDDTGSMRSSVAGTGKSRMTVVQEAMTQLANKHQDSINYYLLDLCGTSEQLPQIGSPIDKNTFITKVNYMYAACGDATDHSIEGFYDAIYFLRKNMNEAQNQYRCQKNFLLYFADGEFNPTNVIWDSEGVAQAAASDMYSSNRSWFDNTSTKFWDCATRTSWPAYSLFGGKYSCRYQGKPDWHKYAKFSPNRNFNTRTTGGNRDFAHPSALAGPADWIRDHDLVTTTSAISPTDAAGKSWDDPDFPMQNIESYAIGLGVDAPSSEGGYLDGGSASAPGHKSIRAQSPEQLFQALDAVLTDIKSKSELNIPSSYSYNTPAVLGEKVVDSAVGVRLLEGLSRSQLRFFSYDEAAQKFKDTDFTTPSFYKKAPPAGAPQNPILTNYNNQNFYLNTPPSSINNQTFGIKDSGYWSYRKNEYKDTFIPWLAQTANGSSIQANDDTINQIAESRGYDYPPGAIKDPGSPRYRIRYDKTKKEDTSNYFMGDVIDAPVVPGGEAFADSSTSAANTMQEFLVTSANDGMTYIFQRNKGDISNPYDLRLRYLPMQMDRSTSDGSDTIATRLRAFMHPQYGSPASTQPHQWLNNGGITVRSFSSRIKDAKNKSVGQQSIMAASPGQGGRGIFALNLGGKDFFTGANAGINANSWKNDIPLFETPKGTNNDLGYIMGNPAIARIAPCRQGGKPYGKPMSISGSIQCETAPTTTINDDDRLDRGVIYATFYGNGYNHPDSGHQESALHVRQLYDKDVGTKSTGAGVGKAGTAIAKISVPGNSGLSTPTVVDIDFDGVVDLAYAATYDGDLYRFDLRKNDPSAWEAHKIFTVQSLPKKNLRQGSDGIELDGSGNPVLETGPSERQKVTVSPDVFRQEVTVGDQKKIRYTVSFGTGSSLYDDDLYDRSVQSIYSIEDRPEEEENPSVVTLSQLAKRTLSDNGTKRFIDATAATTGKRGWYADLNSTDGRGFPSGERIITPPVMIKNSVFFSSVIYDIEKQKSSSTAGGARDLCIAEKTDTKTDTSGWAMVFKADTGDAPGDKSTNIEGLGLDASSTGVGVKLDTVTNYTLFKGIRGKDNQSSVSDSGNSGLSGLDPELNSMDPPNNTCMTKEEAKSWMLVGQSATGISNGLKLVPVICPASNLPIYRINYREVKL